MPWIVAVLLRGLLYLTGSIAGRALIGLGIGVVTYTGMNSSLTWLKGQAVAALQGMGAEYIQLMAYMKVGVCISIVCSAIVARMLINGVQSDTVKRWVLK